MTPVDDMARLYDAQGARKYVCGSEWRRFLDAAAQADGPTRAFCGLLALTGCRISEALALTPAHLDVETGRVTFRTLKRRRRTYRAVPIPPVLMRELRALARGKASDAPLWPWSRTTGWRHVKALMQAARISGVHATPKGLRHGFGIANAEENVPAALTQRWMGHARLETTAIYQHAVGREELGFARRLWKQNRLGMDPAAKRSILPASRRKAPGASNAAIAC